MKPVTLRTARLVLDKLTPDDIEIVTEYCQDPLFEKLLTTPFPYRREHAEDFIIERVPIWWATDAEYTWAIRHDGELVGVIGYRTRSKDVGYWLGGPHRGNGYMPEALGAVLDWVFSITDVDVQWECVPGNAASAAVARKTGFTYRGMAPSIVVDRDGGHAPTHHASIAKTDSREPKPGWPEG